MFVKDMAEVYSKHGPPASLIFRTPGCDARQFSAEFHSRG